MSKKYIDENEFNDGSYVVKKNRKTNILAFILCVLLAFFIWVYTESVGTNNVPSGEAQTQQSADTV